MQPELRPREAPKPVGPAVGSDGGGSYAFRERLDQAAALSAPIVLIFGLALAGGGFETGARHVAGLGVWLVIVGLLVFGATAKTTVGRPLYWAFGLIFGLALLSAISSLWSGSVELSVIEADRVLVYLGFFLAAFLIAQTDQRRQCFAEGLTIAITLIAIVGLASRALPHVLEVTDSVGTGSRLRYPLGYWNANGAVAGIAFAMLLWTSRRSQFTPLRWLSVAAMPPVLLCLYFTYSRGGLLSLIIAVGVFLVLSRDRLWLLATTAIAVLVTLPAVLQVQSSHDLSENLPSETAVHQGATVSLILLAGIAVALGLYWLLLRTERRGGALTGRMLDLSRNRTLLKRAAIVLGLAALVLAIAVGGRAWNQFSSSDIEFPSSTPQAHFGQLSGAGRHEFWTVAIEAFEEKPLLGHGAGTYQYLWQQHRNIDLAVHDAHSLYLQAFAELGVVGGVLTLALVLFLLWCGFGAWRYSEYPQRDRYAVLFAAMVAFAIGAAFDWFWEIAAFGAVFFLAAGVLVSVRCVQLARTRVEAGSGSDGRRYGLVVVGLAVAWISAIALVGPLLVDREIKQSQSAAASGDIGTAVDRAETARSIEPWAASPYVQLGLLAELQEEYPAAAARFTQAIERENHNSQLYFLRARTEQEAGNAAAAEADLNRVRELNPRSPELAEIEG